jgi:hypothetical protein
MKKILALVVLLFIALTACSAPATETTTDETSVTSEPTEAAAIEELVPTDEPVVTDEPVATEAAVTEYNRHEAEDLS